MEWTTEKPTEPGYYWIYTTPVWEDDPIVEIVYVQIINGHLHFLIPCDGYEREDTIEPDRTTHWMGVISEPKPPLILDGN